MPPEARKFIWDAGQAVRRLGEFTAGKPVPRWRAPRPLDWRASRVFRRPRGHRGLYSPGPDLLVISDSLRYPELFEAVQTAESALARKISPTVLSRTEWRAKRQRTDSFAARIASQPKLFVIGGEDDLA